MKRHLLKNVAHLLARTEPYFWSLWIPDRLLDRMEPARGKNGDFHLVLAATGGGNIGDQALLESVLQNVSGKIVVLCRHIDDVSIPAEHAPRTTVKALPNLLNPIPLMRLADGVRFRRIAAEAREFSIIGADLMDGLYNPGASIGRSSLLIAAHAQGCESRVLGFSWPSAPVGTATRALRWASKVGTVIARDPASFNRLRAAGLGKAVLAADVVFTLQGQEPVPEVAKALRSDVPLAVVNVSALIQKRFDQTADYGEIIDALRALGYAIVVLPHVIRRSGNDLEASLEVLNGRLREGELVSRLLTPREVRWVVSRAGVVVTGRMHLAILALAQGVPAITLGTQGKVEGLYEHVSLPHFAVDPLSGFGRRIADLVAGLESDRAGVAKVLETRRERVHQLALRNFR